MIRANYGRLLLSPRKAILLLLVLAIPAAVDSTGRNANGARFGIYFGIEVGLIMIVWSIRSVVRRRHRKLAIARDSAEAASHELPGSPVSQPKGLTFGQGSVPPGASQ